MKVLITSRSGYISKVLVRSLSTEHNITVIGRADLDLTDSFEVDKWFENKLFDVVIHTAINGGSRLVKEDDKVLSDNLKMYFNLLKHKAKYNKFISFGSIAENSLHSSLYGLSKNIISRYIGDEPNFYNLKICGVFDSNENDTRFIKSNILRYISKVPQVIHQDKYMDFIYMDDLLSVVNEYIKQDRMPKIIDCVYSKKILLSEISSIINSLDTHKVAVQIDNTGKVMSYVGNGSVLEDLNLNLLGLEKGIQNTYIALKK